MVAELVISLLIIHAIVVVESFRLNSYYNTNYNINFNQRNIDNDYYNRKQGQRPFTATNSILLNLSPKRNQQSSTTDGRISNKQRKPTTTTVTTTTTTNNSSSDFFSNCVSYDNSTDIITGPFDFSKLVNYWGKKPILIRNAFDVNSTDIDSLTTVIPSWDDIISLSCWDVDSNNNNSDDNDDDTNEYDTSSCSGESARLIQHTTGELNSFDLQIGPFDTSYLENIFSSSTSSKKQKSSSTSTKKWTLIVNDVNKYIESVQRWMDNTFNFISRWRRDDIQISIANNGGGIGPHVDNYDVCLLQFSGCRCWELFPNLHLSVQDEYTILVPNLSVRILNMSTIIDTSNTTQNLSFTSTGTFELSRLILYPGDMLYLPPRIVHCGTAVSDKCMTVSVGFRSPSASDIVNTVAESIQQSIHDTAVCRYTDPLLDYHHHPINITSEQNNYCTNSNNQPSITQQVRDDFKNLLQDSVSNIINDQYNFDKLIGELITRPIRYSDNDIIPYPYNINKSVQLFFGTDATNVLETMIQHEQQQEAETSSSQQQQQQQQLHLIVSEGVSCATSYFEIKSKENNNNDDNSLYFVNRLYARGIMYEVVTTSTTETTITKEIFKKIENGAKIYSKDIIHSFSLTKSLNNYNNIGNNFSKQTLRQILITLIHEGIVKPQL